MSFKEILAQKSAVEFLKSVYEQDRLAHAYCFVGPDGIGKKKTAINFAKLLLCDAPAASDSCGMCPSCRKIDSLSHPDLQWVSPDGNFIKIDAVREACRRLNLRGFESSRKVLIVDDAHALNEESSNALLKTLEEPSQHTVIILIARSLRSILSTIASRCQRVVFSALKEDDVYSFLVNKNGLSQEEASYLAKICEGSLGMALRYHECGLFGKKNRMIDAALDAREPLGSLLPGGANEKAERDEALLEMLLVLSSWFRDLLLAKMKKDVKILINTDRQEDIRKNSSIFSFGDIEERLNAIADTQASMRRNVNVRLAVAKMRVDLWKP